MQYQLMQHLLFKTIKKRAMKAKNVQQIVCAEGSRTFGPGRVTSNPEPGEQGRQREIIIIQNHRRRFLSRNKYF